MEMLWPALAGLVLFLLYDLWSVDPGRLRWPKTMFWGGFLCWGGATVYMIGAGCKAAQIGLFTALFGLLAAVFLALLVYSLFFALPKGTYTDPTAPRGVYSGGMYALCRHPGVLWFLLFYLCLYLALPCPVTLWGCAALCGGNLLYILFQDIYTFPRTFYNYKSYQRGTPFLLPSPASIRRAIGSFSQKGTAAHEN